MFWLERVNFHDPTCSSVDFCLYYLSVSGFPQNHHFCLYLFMGYSDILSSASVVRDLMTVKPPTVSPVLSALPFRLNFVRSSQHILCFVLLNSQLVKNEAEERETLLLSTFLFSFQCVITSDTTLLSDKISLQPEELPSSFLRVQISWEHIYSALIHLKMSLFILNV